jgi:hypothetical protein
MGIPFQTKFTPEQDQLIKTHYPRMSKEELTSLIPFPWNSIVRRAERLKVKRDLSFIHIKNYLPSGESVQDFANKNEIPLSTANQIFNKEGGEFLSEFTPDKKQNALELKFFLLFKDILPIERWDKFLSKEFDLNYKPDFKISIENKTLFLNIDGLCYHIFRENESNSSPSPYYHMEMQKAFKDKNVNLMQFRSDELDESPDIIKSIVCNYFNIQIVKIRASKCQIKELTSIEAKNFFNENHLMKYSKASAYGLYLNKNLVAAMSYKKFDNHIEISRFCSKKMTRVYGGFSKLLSHICGKHNPSFVVSFCDLRYATGRSYINCGFNLTGITLGWRWANNIKTYNRRSCRANMDERGLSEAEYAKEFKLSKIYDAGQAKYVRSLKEEIYKEESSLDLQNEILDIAPKETSRLYWKKEEEQYLKELFELTPTRAVLIEQFCLRYPQKTKNAVIGKLSQLKLTRDPKIYFNVGDTYGFWTIIEIPSKGQHVKCKCVCGEEKLVRKNFIKTKKSRSCGCKSIELATETCMNTYGSPRASATEATQAKIDQTSKNKYGAKRASQTPEVKAKIVETNQQKYKKNRYSQTEEFKERREEIRNKTREAKLKTLKSKLLT